MVFYSRIEADFPHTRHRRSSWRRFSQWGVFNFRPLSADRSCTLVMGYSVLTRLFSSRVLEPKLYRWALRLTGFGMTISWRAGSCHHLFGMFNRFLRPCPAAEMIDYSFPDDSTSGKPKYYWALRTRVRQVPLKGDRAAEGGQRRLG